MFPLKYLRENLDFIESCIEKRGNGFDVGKLKVLLEEYHGLLTRVESDRAKRNENASKVAELKSQKKAPSESLIAEMRNLSQNLKRDETDLSSMSDMILAYAFQIPNILDERVKLGKNDEDNEEVKRFGKPREFSFKPLDHVEIAEKHGIIDYERATKMVGSRFSHFRAKGAKLHRALVQFFLDENIKNGFEEHFPPFIVNEETLFAS